MQAYRFYFLGSDGHIKAVETITCADDTTAKQMAAALLDEKQGYHSVEVWREKQMVHQVRRS